MRSPAPASPRYPCLDRSPAVTASSFALRRLRRRPIVGISIPFCAGMAMPDLAEVLPINWTSVLPGWPNRSSIRCHAPAFDPARAGHIRSCAGKADRRSGGRAVWISQTKAWVAAQSRPRQPSPSPRTIRLMKWRLFPGLTPRRADAMSGSSGAQSGSPGQYSFAIQPLPCNQETGIGVDRSGASADRVRSPNPLRENFPSRLPVNPPIRATSG